MVREEAAAYQNQVEGFISENEGWVLIYHFEMLYLSVLNKQVFYFYFGLSIAQRLHDSDLCE